MMLSQFGRDTGICAGSATAGGTGSSRTPEQGAAPLVALAVHPGPSHRRRRGAVIVQAGAEHDDQDGRDGNLADGAVGAVLEAVLNWWTWSAVKGRPPTGVMRSSGRPC
jgi:hypothetical protein